MKKKLFTILSTVVFTILLGYLFLLSWLIGFLASKYVAGKSTGERGNIYALGGFMPDIPLREDYNLNLDLLNQDNQLLPRLSLNNYMQKVGLLFE